MQPSHLIFRFTIMVLFSGRWMWMTGMFIPSVKMSGVSQSWGSTCECHSVRVFDYGVIHSLKQELCVWRVGGGEEVTDYLRVVTETCVQYCAKAEMLCSAAGWLCHKYQRSLFYCFSFCCSLEELSEGGNWEVPKCAPFGFSSGNCSHTSSNWNQHEHQTKIDIKCYQSKCY
jgi:hypothetical protein